MLDRYLTKLLEQILEPHLYDMHLMEINSQNFMAKVMKDGAFRKYKQ